MVRPNEPRDDPEAQAGEQIGHYRLQEIIGGGGMGVIYRAEDTRLGRTVAIKLLPPELTRDPVSKARFFQEARAASALEHPNLCTLYDAGETEDGLLWLAMPCYGGETLHDLLDRGPLPVEEAVDVARQIALGLAKAHRQGIVHRDIKPANLVITGDGVKILDFGIAKLSGEERLTRVGMVVGTLGYMSPEQASGGEVDHRTDLWSLGAVLYEMLAGRRSFSGDLSPAALAAIFYWEPEPLATKRPDVPPGLEGIVRKLLARDPDERYASAEEVAAALRALDTSAPRSPAPTAWPSWGPWVAGALLVLLVAGGAVWLLRAPGASTAAPVVTRLTNQEGIELHPSLSPNGDVFVYAKDDGGDLDIFLQRIGGQPANLTGDSPVDDTHPAFSPDGSRIAFRSERAGGGLFLMGATGESVRRLTDRGFNPTWSPDGRQIAFASQPVSDPSTREKESQLWILDIASEQQRLLLQEDAVQPSWSPGGRRIAYWGLPPGTSRREIWTVAVEGGEPALVTDDGGINWNPVWAPDGRHLYFSSDRNGIMNLWRIQVDEETGRVSGQPEAATLGTSWSGDLSFSRDGNKILFATREKRTDLLKVELDPGGPTVRGEAARVTRGIRELSFASVSPDGAWIVLSSRGEQEDLFVQRSDGSGFRQLTEDPAKDRAPVWMPDGRILFRSDRTGRWEAWSIRLDGSDLRPLTAQSQGSGVVHPIVSPDGRRLLFGLGFTGAAWVDLSVPLEHRIPQRLPPAPGTAFFPHSWSRDGRRLVGNTSSGVLLFSFDTGRYTVLAPEGALPLWMRDQQRILWRDGDRSIRWLDIPSGRSGPVIAPVSGTLFSAFDLSPDNRWLYLLCTTEEGDLWTKETDRE